MRTNIIKSSMVYFFNTQQSPNISEVGGKGFSLIKGTQNGFPVPKGFVLTIVFFTNWIDEIKKSKNWYNFVNSDVKDWLILCNNLKEDVNRFSLNSEQKNILNNSLSSMNTSLFAVRSSSPEEDLDGSSFAGGYETVLGVASQDIESAIKQTFASCLDYRIFSYKKENGFDIYSPKISIIVQEQIHSESAGVAFSINPVTNNFDEIVINSNWGLGETVVSGTATPDTFVINKISRKTISSSPGKKEKVIILKNSSGIEESINNKHDKFSLNSKQLKQLTELVRKVEKIYGKPMDIEWAFYKEKLYLLQARPITAFVPLSESMITEPGKPKYIYQDMTISVQGLHKAMSPFSTSLLSALINSFWKMIFNKDVKLNPHTSLVWIENGKMFSNITNAFALTSRKKFAKNISNMDSLASKTIEAIDLRNYSKPNLSTIKLKLTVVFIAIKLCPFILRAIIFPRHYFQLNHKKLENFREEIQALYNEHLPLEQFIDITLSKTIQIVFKYSGPTSVIARFMLDKIIKKLSNIADSNDLYYLTEALPNNVTTEMGISLFELAAKIPKDLTQSDLIKQYYENTIESNFKKSFDIYMEKYGHRCPGELDAATPRYRDNPEDFFKLLFSLKSTADQKNPSKNFEELKQKRIQAYNNIYSQLKQKSFIKALTFRFKYRFIERFAGTRESHKYYLIFAVDKIRQKLLKQGDMFVKENRLTKVEDIFKLKINDIISAANDPNLDLKAISDKNNRFIEKLNRVPQLPTVFDSRGLILRPPKQKSKDKNIFSGMPISPGISKATAKILNTPTEKPFQKGEILIAKATDPAWTPLFVNASAVILEVGGLLQHGALVAREYGLPCIAGIENATSIFKDGEILEVDGAAGTVKKITNEEK